MEKYIKFANRGKAFENTIEMMNSVYEKQGLGKIQFNPTSHKSVKNKQGEIINFYDKKSTVDFLGCLEYRTVAFDAKECSAERWNLKTNFKRHQEEALHNFRRGGAASFILLHMKKYNEVYMVPLLEVQKFIAEGLKSVSIKDLRTNRLLYVSRGDQLPDYWKVIKRFAGQNVL